MAYMCTSALAPQVTIFHSDITDPRLQESLLSPAAQCIPAHSVCLTITIYDYGILTVLLFIQVRISQALAILGIIY